MSTATNQQHDTITDLRAQQEAATQRGDYDAAVALGDQIERLQKIEAAKASGIAPGPLDSTLALAAKQFAYDHADRFAYVGAYGWLVFDDIQGWRRVDDDECRGADPVRVAYVEWLEKQLARADALPRDKEGDRKVWEKRRNAVKAFGHHMPAILTEAQRFARRTPTEFAEKPDELRTPNGVVNLRTGVLRDATRKDAGLRRTAVEYHPDAQAPRFQRFLAEIFPDRNSPPQPDGTPRGDAEAISYMQRALGYSVTGDYQRHIYHLWYGPKGRNGKGTLATVVADTLGSYAYKMEVQTLLSQKHGRSGANNDIADLDGVRFAYAEEPDTGCQWDKGRLKELTGGGSITARHLYKELYTFRQTAKIHVLANKRPKVHDAGEALWARSRTVPFNETFLGREDFTLEATLATEQEGILTWLVHGAVAYYAALDAHPPRDPLPDTAATRQAKAEYQEADDVLRAFFRDQVVKAEGATMHFTTAYRLYREWAREITDDPLTKDAFRGVLDGYNCPTTLLHGYSIVHGLRERTRAEVMQAAEEAAQAHRAHLADLEARRSAATHAGVENNPPSPKPSIENFTKDSLGRGGKYSTPDTHSPTHGPTAATTPRPTPQTLEELYAAAETFYGWDKATVDAFVGPLTDIPLAWGQIEYAA